MSQFESKFESINALPQKKFRSMAQRAMLNILYTNNWMCGKIKGVLDEENITMQQYNIMRILRGAKKPLSLQQVRESLLDKMSDTSRVIDRMIIKGLVQKAHNEVDKRVLEISLTETGFETLKKIDDKDFELDAIIKNISEQEAAELSRILDKIRGIVHDENEQ